MNLKLVIEDAAKIRQTGGIYIWKPFMRKYNCQVICEVGVQNGTNFTRFIKHEPRVAVAIDCWINDGTISRNDGGYSQKILDMQYATFKESVKNKPFVIICRQYSFDAVNNFKDEYFDVVYIDADHSYEGCLRDLRDWYPKIRKGKFLFGDDYRPYGGKRPGVGFGVIEAINTFTKENNLDFFELPSFGWVIIKK